MWILEPIHLSTSSEIKIENELHDMSNITPCSFDVRDYRHSAYQSQADFKYWTKNVTQI